MRICSIPLPHASVCFPSALSPRRGHVATTRCPPYRLHSESSNPPIFLPCSPCSRAVSGLTKLVVRRRKRILRNGLEGKCVGRKVGRCGFCGHGNGLCCGGLQIGPRCRAGWSLQRNKQVPVEIVDSKEDQVQGIRRPNTLALLPTAWLKAVGGLVHLALLSLLENSQQQAVRIRVERIKGFGRVLGFGIAVMLVALFPHRSLARYAFAASPAAVTSADAERGDKQFMDKSAVQDREDASSKLTEEDRARLAEEARKEAVERESRIMATLQLDERLKELEEFLAEKNLVSQKRPEVQNRLHDLRVFANAKIRQYRGSVIKEMQLTVTKLKQQQDDVNKEARKAANEYGSLSRQLAKATGEESTSKEKALKIAEEKMQALWKRNVQLAADVLAEDLEASRTAYTDLPAVQDRINAELSSFWKTWNEKLKAREMKTIEEARDKEVVQSLEVADQKIMEQNVLPLAVGVDDLEDSAGDGPLDPEAANLMQEIKLEEEKSRRLDAIIEKLAENEAQNRKLLDGLPQDEADLVLKSVNVVIPEGLDPSMSLSWTESEEFKQFLSDNPETRKEYEAEKKEQILIARDRVVAETFYNEKQKRWEMAPKAVPYAVAKRIVAKARVRQDRRVMYITLKGDDREYYVNLQAYEAEFHEHGGCEELYIKMTGAGINISYEQMWVPLSEWDVGTLFQLPFKIVFWALQDIWNSGLVRTVWPFYWKTLSEVFEEIMTRFGFPVLQAGLPSQARVALQLDLPEGAEAAEPTDIMAWQQEAQKNVDARYGEGTGSPAWWISLPLRAYAVGAPLYLILKYVGPTLIYPFKPKPLEPNEVEWKEQKQKELMKDLEPQTKKDKKDPIKSVFDNMKRVKRPLVSLKDFAGIDSVKEEINEAITFLRNPKLFKEIGARPPRGILIVGESGTGKTTLALAIAAEARVPMIELQGAELEGGSWVGQGASNVRELFKTARELAPLIIFMDDFDHFAGVRGATSDTRKQDHESLINQLLVELDGFETQEGVVLIATTSRPWAIDEALRRPGRMDRTINLPMPNRGEREQILRKVAQDSMDAHLIPFVDWTMVAEKTAGLTPAQLKHVPQGIEGSAVSCKIVDDEELFSLFGWLATFNSITPRWVKDTGIYKHLNNRLLDWLDLRVTKEEVEAAVEAMDVTAESNPGLELSEPPYVWTRESKYPHAVWAAGRGLVALLLPDFDVVDQIWLDPTSWEGIGFTKLSKRLAGGYKETGIVTRSYYEKELVLCFGSFIASRLYIKPGDNNNLSRFEIEKAQEIATRMVLEHGWSPDDSAVIYMPEGASGSLTMGEDHELELEEKVQKLFHAACDRATQMLLKNRKVLDALLEHLLQFDIATKKDMTRILEENGAALEEEPFNLVPYTRAETSVAPTNGTSRSMLLPAGTVA